MKRNEVLTSGRIWEPQLRWSRFIPSFYRTNQIDNGNCSSPSQSGKPGCGSISVFGHIITGEVVYRTAFTLSLGVLTVCMYD